MPTAERGAVPAPVAGVSATEIAETRPGAPRSAGSLRLSTGRIQREAKREISDLGEQDV